MTVDRNPAPGGSVVEVGLGDVIRQTVVTVSCCFRGLKSGDARFYTE
jgi:hypothetical protein